MEQQKKKSRRWRVLFFAICTLMALGLYQSHENRKVRHPPPREPSALAVLEPEEIPANELMKLAPMGDFKKVRIVTDMTSSQKKIYLTFQTDGKMTYELFARVRWLDDSFEKFVIEKRPDIPLYYEEAKPANKESPGALKQFQEMSFWSKVLVMSALLGTVLFVAFFWYVIRQGKKAQQGMMGTKNSARKNLHVTTTFKDVGGIDEARAELEEVVDMLKNSSKYRYLGARIPKGILLMGPPGTGKTLLARAVAGETGFPLLEKSGSGFDEMFIGVGAARGRELFKEAREVVKTEGKCILFIDEIDGVGGKRGPGIHGADREYNKTLNQLMAELDGMDSNEGIIIIGATNAPENLDSALLRPGRFDRHIVVGLPDIKGREAILKIHVRNTHTPAAKDLDLREVARITTRFSGAQLANLVNEAAIIAAKKNKHKVDIGDFREAYGRVILGAERRLKISETEQRAVAFHEAGHAIVGLFTESESPDIISQVTVIPHGPGLGVTVESPKEDTYLLTQRQAFVYLMYCFGGREGERFVTKDISSGASGDIMQATNHVRRMVREWGMSEKVGPLRMAEGQLAFLGVSGSSDCSEKFKALADEESRRILLEAQEATKKLVESHEKELRALANALLEYETLYRPQILEIVGLPPDPASETTA